LLTDFTFKTPSVLRQVFNKNDHIIQESVRGMYLKRCLSASWTRTHHIVAPLEIFMMDSLVARSRL